MVFSDVLGLVLIVISGGMRACKACVKAKISCDSSRPCHQCRERNRVHLCVDEAREVVSCTPFLEIALKSTSPIDLSIPVPPMMSSVWRYSHRKYSNSVLQAL